MATARYDDDDGATGDDNDDNDDYSDDGNDGDGDSTMGSGAKGYDDNENGDG